jgi:hypothetical protein
MPSSTPSQASLISNANKFSSPLDARDFRYERREGLRLVSARKRVKDCGLVPHGPVIYKNVGGKVFATGLTSCGSVWGCPVCSSRILTHRSIETAAAIEAWSSQGGYFVFETLTLPHNRTTSIREQRKAITEGWKAVNGGSFAKTHKGFGQVGYLKAIEVTYGDNGFHLHLHVLRFVSRDLGEAELNAWGDSIFTKWKSGVQKSGIGSPSTNGHNFQKAMDPKGLSGYFTKGFDSAGASLTQSPWKLLTKAIETPKSEYTFIWRTWENESLGMKQIAWSKGLRSLLGLGKNLEDEEIPSEPELLIEIEPESINRFGHLGHVQSRFRRLLEKGLLAEAKELLEANGIQYRIPAGGPFTAMIS